MDPVQALSAVKTVMTLAEATGLVRSATSRALAGIDATTEGCSKLRCMRAWSGWTGRRSAQTIRLDSSSFSTKRGPDFTMRSHALGCLDGRWRWLVYLERRSPS